MELIKVKMIGSDGNVKGRAYTYKSAIPVSVGDRVVADMAGKKKTLQVVETGISKSEIEGLSYEIKLIDGLAEEEIEKTEQSVDLRMTEEVMPVISMNFEEVKAYLSQMLRTYDGIVVTEQTLQGCKATQKELAGIRTRIDKWRKEKKKQFQAPIAAFEAQCKDLIAMVESVEAPIKHGISLYDDERRAAKRKEAETIREELLKDSGLNETYQAMLGIKDVYCNLTANKAMIRNDLQAEIETLLEKQKAEEMKEAAILAAIDAQNGRLNKKLTLEDFKYMMRAEHPTIIREIQLKADIIFEAENPQEVPETEEEITKPAEDSIPEEPKKYAVYKVQLQGELDVIKRLLSLARADGLEVTVLGEMEL